MREVTADKLYENRQHLLGCYVFFINEFLVSLIYTGSLIYAGSLIP